MEFQQGKIRISNSFYATHIAMVRKPDLFVHVCIDYRAINERTVRYSFPLPSIDDLIDKLREGSCIAHHLDLQLVIIKSEYLTMGRQTAQSQLQIFKV